MAKDELEKIPEIDLCLGTNEKKDIVKYIESYIENKKNKSFYSEVLRCDEYADFGSVTYTEKTRAVIKIQDGCNRFCSYCLIPYARGKVRSRSKESILTEIKEIIKHDMKEIVLTGIHIASYGKDFKNSYKLIDLLEDINQMDGIERIRLRINGTAFNG